VLFRSRPTEKTTMIRNILLALAAIAALSACNTMKGAGKDVSAAGDAVSDQATETQKSM